MSKTISEKVAQAGLTLPVASVPAANYVPWVRTGNLVFVSGQVPLLDGKVAYVGKVGHDVSVEDAQKAAQVCALNVLAHLSAAVNDELDRVVRCVRLGGFVNATPDFTAQPQVINGASDLMVAVLGDAGRHSRAAVGVGSLPRGVPVEVDAIFEVK